MKTAVGTQTISSFSAAFTAAFNNIFPYPVITDTEQPMPNALFFFTVKEQYNKVSPAELRTFTLLLSPKS
ncbi:MAG TPA: hypothetical protein VFS36_10615 [Chitinophagaceae bacterium]|nr:hypothetical protein [Chitinophagaceae bacterium]